MARNLTLKITKVFRFVTSFTATPVVSSLAPHGLDAEEMARGRQLVAEAQRLSATKRTHVVRSDAWKAVGLWGTTWLPVARAALKKNHPAVFEQLFAGIERPNRSELPAAVHLFATRVLALAASDEADRQVVWAHLAKRGFEVATLESMRDDVMKKPAFELVDDRAATREKAIADAWDFYLEWSKIARAVIKDKRVRALMGLPTRRLPPTEAPQVEPLSAI